MDMIPEESDSMSQTPQPEECGVERENDTALGEQASVEALLVDGETSKPADELGKNSSLGILTGTTPEMEIRDQVYHWPTAKARSLARGTKVYPCSLSILVEFMLLTASTVERVPHG